jgi:UDPglucose 6-dehydrogenase
MTRATIGVVGLSHLGTVVSAGLASLGLPVTAVDRPDRVGDFAPGRLPYPEPGLAEMLAGPRPTFTAGYSTLAEAALIILAVDTLTDEHNRSDVSVLEAHVDGMLPWLRADAVVVLMSQVPVGYTRALAARMRARRPDLVGRVYYWVETLVIGDAVARYLRPERIIVGGPTGPEPALEALLGRFACPVHRMDYESAELCKAAINLYLATSVTFANALADLCEATGASMRAIIPALRADRRIGPAAYIRPGLGLAGGNLERDLVHLKELAARSGVRTDLFDVILERSAARYGWLQASVARWILEATPHPRLALWGLAYKKNTDSTKNAVSLRLAADLRSRARLVAYDPRVIASIAGVDRAPSALEAARGADGLVILTDWDEFAAIDLALLRSTLGRPVVVDAAGVLDPARARAAGLTHVAIGEPA